MGHWKEAVHRKKAVTLGPPPVMNQKPSKWSIESSQRYRTEVGGADRWRSNVTQIARKDLQHTSTDKAYYELCDMTYPLRQTLYYIVCFLALICDHSSAERRGVHHDRVFMRQQIVLQAALIPFTDGLREVSRHKPFTKK